MGSLKALTLAGVLALAAIPTMEIAAANAADLLPPQPQLEPPPLRGPIEDSGFYLRGDVGVGIAELGDVRQTFNPNVVVPGVRVDQANLADSAIIGIGLGYQVNSWFHADVTGEYRSSAHYSAAASYDSTQFGGTCGNNLAVSGRCTDLYTGNIRSAVFLVNGYVNMGNWFGLSPYVGAGVGFSNIQVGTWTDQSIGNTGGGYSAPTSFNNLAWALMAGLDYHVAPNLILDMRYRYLNQGNVSTGAIVCQPLGANVCPMEVQHFQLASNDLTLGMRWLIAPPAPPPVIQTRY